MWGDSEDGKLDAPSGLYKQIAVGGNHAIALSAGGYVHAWGSNSYGQLNVKNRQAIAVATGNNISAILQPNGTVLLSGTWAGVSGDPPGEFVAIDIGLSSLIGLRPNGDVFVWGNHNTIPSGLHGNTVDIAAGRSHLLVLKSDGSVVTWGSDISPPGTYGDVFQIPSGLANVVAISACEYTSTALTSDGYVWCWGANFWRLAYYEAEGRYAYENWPAVFYVPGAVDVIATEMWCYALDSYGNLYALVPGGGGQSDGVWWSLPEISGPHISVPSGLMTYAVSAGPNTVGVLRGVTDFSGSTQSSSTLSGDFPLIVEFQDLSSNDPYFWEWNFGDGNVVSGNTIHEKNPVHVYEQEGVFDVTLTVQTYVGEVSITKEAYVTVTTPPPIAIFVPDVIMGDVPMVVSFANMSYGPGPLSYLWRFGDGSTSTEESPTHVYDRPGPFTASLVVTSPWGCDVHLCLVFAAEDNPVGSFGVNIRPPEPSTLTASAVYTGTAFMHDGIFFAHRSDGSIVPWNPDRGYYGSTDVPTGEIFLGASIKYMHGLGITISGDVVSWGYNTDGQCNVPSGLKGVKCATGAHHSLVLKPDGTVVGFGSNSDGRTSTPLGLMAVDISAGFYHSLAVRVDGTVAAWGQNTYGQCNVPEGLDRVVRVEGGTYHSVALRDDGSIVAWGNVNLDESFLPEGTVVVDIAAGEGSVAVLTDDSKLIVSAHDDNIPDGFARSISATGYAYGVSGYYPPRIFLEMPRASGPYPHTIRPKVTLAWDWGAQVLWDFGDGRFGDGKSPIHVYRDPGRYYGQILAENALGADTQDIFVDSLGVGSLVTWDFWSDGSHIPSEDGIIGVALDIVGLACSDYFGYFAALLSDGTVIHLRYDSVANCLRDVWWPVDVGDVPFDPEIVNNVVAIDAGDSHYVALKSDGAVIAWGNNNYGQCNVPEGLKATAIACAFSGTIAIREDGTIACWGWNFDGSGEVYGDYVPPANLRDVIEIAAGYAHCLALRDDGTVVAWGENSTWWGMPPGCGSTDVEDLTGVYKIAAGEYLSAYIIDGKVLLRGENSGIWRYFYPDDNYLYPRQDAVDVTLEERTMFILHINGDVTQIGGIQVAT